MAKRHGVHGPSAQALHCVHADRATLRARVAHRTISSAGLPQTKARVASRGHFGGGETCVQTNGRVVLVAPQPLQLHL